MDRRSQQLAGRYFFACALAGAGIQQIFCRDFVRLAAGLPGWIPWHSVLAVLSGLLLVGAAAAVFFRHRLRPAAWTVAALLLILFCVFYVPQIVGNPLTGFIWTNPCKTLALIGGALLLAENPDRIAPATAAEAFRRKKTRLFCLIALSVFLIVCGIQHFVYADFVDTLVPSWIPPGQRFWTYFAAAALIAGGIGLLLPRTKRLAATWTGIMVFLWVLLLHIPRTIELKSLFELDGVFEALAISGTAFMLSGTIGRNVKAKNSDQEAVPESSAIWS
jgi:uncharacterized membrane protein